ncbi:hypothetical protein FJ364_02555 [Candidatus Dependentiae bacterium]|nr:hypothetical protein [Candidatus Dependentiae bacterium]
MTKRLVSFVSAAVLSFGMSLSAVEVTTPVVSVSEVEKVEVMLRNLEAQGITREEVFAAVASDKNIKANNIDWANLQSMCVNGANHVVHTSLSKQLLDLTPAQLVATVAVVVAMYYGVTYGVPAVKNAGVTVFDKIKSLGNSKKKEEIVSHAHSEEETGNK